MFTLGFEGLELDNIINADSNSTKWLDQMKEWKDMPEFSHGDNTPYKRLIVNFDTKKELLEIDVIRFNITDIDIDVKSNGTIIRLKTKKRYAWRDWPDI